MTKKKIFGSLSHILSHNFKSNAVRTFTILFKLFILNKSLKKERKIIGSFYLDEPLDTNRTTYFAYLIKKISSLYK